MSAGSERVLRLVTTDAGPLTRFCGSCGEQPDPASTSRVCDHCSMGVVLSAASTLAPAPGSAFLVVDASMAIRAASDGAARYLGSTEEDLVVRQVTELFEPAEVTRNAPTSVSALLRSAAFEDDVRTVYLRPVGMFGLRVRARVGGCGSPPATLVVLDV